jgi:hypothetical protein
MSARPQKITFAELRAQGVHGLLVCCQDYRCSHSIEISADPWPDHLRSSDIEAALSARPSVDAVLMPGRLAERGVAIPGPGDYVRVRMS